MSNYQSMPSTNWARIDCFLKMKSLSFNGQEHALIQLFLKPFNSLIMSLTLADQYFLKASDNYAYDMEQTVESLNYALSYDEMHPAANCLMGRLLMEKLKRFSAAQHCFERALIEDPNYVDTYKFYSLLLIWMGKLDKANQIIDRGFSKTGMPKLVMIKRKATLLEAQGNIKAAIKENKRGRLLSAGQFDFDHFNGEVKRLKQKCKKAKKGAPLDKGEPIELLLEYG